MKTAGLILGLSLLATPPCWAYATVRLNNIDSGNPVSFYEDPFLNYGPVYVDLVYTRGDGLEHIAYSLSTHDSVFGVDKNGFFDGGIGELPDVDASGTVTFTLRAWEGSPDDLYPPIQNRAIWTQTGFISWDPESGLPPSGTVLNIPPTISAPEPGTLVLATLGGSLLAAQMAYKNRRASSE